MGIALVVSFGEISHTDAAWTDDAHSSASFTALELGRVQNLQCSDDEDSLLDLNLLNSDLALTWDPPEGFANHDSLEYVIIAHQGGIGGSSRTFYTSETQLGFEPFGSVLSLSLSFTIMARLESNEAWAGPETNYTASLVGLLGISVRASCDPLLGIVQRDASQPDATTERALGSPTAQTEATDNVDEEGAPTSTRNPESTNATSSPHGTASVATTSSRTTATTPIHVPTPSATATSMTPSLITTTTTTADPTSTISSPLTHTVTATPSTPTPTVSTEPAPLLPTAETETVATVDIDGTEHDVVVNGGTAPDDAATAAPALEAWINDDTRPTGDWKTFTSADSDEDGWRWAAVNQETGTVVYIR